MHGCRELKCSRRRLLQAEDDDTAEQLSELAQILHHTEISKEFDEELFKSITEKIIAESQERIRFRLIGGLELAEPIHGRGR